MQTNQIKMHQTNSKDIIEGNLKSIMRLILALAAHFKPTNVQPCSNLANSKNSNTFSPSANCAANPKRNPNVNKRSQSSNNVNRNNNNTYVVEACRTSGSPHSSGAFNSPKQPQNQGQQQQQQQYANMMSNANARPSQNQSRNQDSMTHLLQAACVSLADVRRYKHDNFNVKYVKCNNLMPPANASSPSSASSPSTVGVVTKNLARPPDTHYLTPVNPLNANQQTYQISSSNYQLKEKTPTYSNNNNDETHSSISSSPPQGAPAASSTVLMPHNSTRIETKTCRSK